jgi:Glyoxalase-like domain
MSSSSDDDSSSGSSAASDEHQNDAKMKALLAEWDNKDPSENNDIYEDSDDDNSDNNSNDKATLTRKAPTTTEVGSDDDDDDEEEEEEEEEEEVEEFETPVSKNDDEASAKKFAQASRAPTVTPSADDDDEGEVVDDGNIEDTLKKKPKKKKEKSKIVPITSITAEDTEEDAAMKALLAEWGADEPVEDDDDDDDDADDDSSAASEREVQLEDNVIDHIVLAAPNLEEAMEQFEKMTGIGAVVAGSINGLGIKCSRISFNDSSYIEIIAPDPKSSGPIGQLLKSKGITELTPFHFAIRTSKVETLKDEVKKFGYVPDHITMFGGHKDGTPMKWEMLYLYGHDMGGICPFFINWSNSDHPCVKLPVVGKLKKFTIRAPEDDPVHKLLEHIDIKGFNVETGKPKLSFQFSSPEGTIKFATSKAVGFKFPGFDDEEHGLDGRHVDDEDVVFDAPETPELLAIGHDVGEYEALPAPVY